MLTTLLNPVAWLLACVCIASAIAARRGALGRDVLAPVSSWAQRPIVAGALILAALVSAGPRAFLGYVAPGSYAEDVVAARELLARGGTRSQDDREAFRQWLAEEPAPVTPWTLPGLSSCQASALQERGRFFTAQGHPPFLMLAAAPVVWAVGGRGTFVVFTLVSLASLWMLAKRLPGTRATTATLSLAALLACWQPVLASLRQGDVPIVLAALVLAMWSAVGRNRTIVAGVAAGLAGSISIGAAPLALLAFVHSRRAGLAALATLAATTCASVLAAGPLVLVDYVDALRGTSASYAAAPFNYTLVGRLPRDAALASAAALIALTCVLAWKAASHGGGRGKDLGIAAGAALIPLLCPVAWSQHLVVVVIPAGVLLAVARDRGAGWLCLLALLLLAVSLPDRPVAWIAHILPPALRAAWPAVPLVALYGWLLVELRRSAKLWVADAVAA